MSRRRSVIALSISLACAGDVGAAQSATLVELAPAPIDARVVQIVSGGAWSERGQSGQYRVVVRSDSVDINRYSTVVEWMVRNGIDQPLVFVRSVEIRGLSPKWYSVLGPALKLTRGGRWVLEVDAAEGPLKPASHRQVFFLGPPGVIAERE